MKERPLDPTALKERIETAIGRRLYSLPLWTDDASDYTRLTAGTVLSLAAGEFYISGEAREGRFGIEEQPKAWVKYAFDLADGARKILKFAFHEQFTTHFGPFTVRCLRNPAKESRLLGALQGDLRFMQGFTSTDTRGQQVRVIEFIKGQSLYAHLAGLEAGHEEYYHEILPGLWPRVIGCIEALQKLHDLGEQHGDVRNDHILIEPGSGVFRWIDFDYEANFEDYDVWCVGNILSYLVGKGIHDCRSLSGRPCAEGAHPRIGPDDALLFFRHRLANLHRLYPYISPSINEILMRFAVSTEDFYEDVGSIIADMRAVAF